MTTIGAEWRRIQQTLENKGLNPAPGEGRAMVAAALGLGNGDFLTREHEELSIQYQGIIEGYLSDRSTGKPLAYVLGRADFAGREWRVSAEVLIPRPDTETLVQTGLERLITGCSADAFWMLSGPKNAPNAAKWTTQPSAEDQNPLLYTIYQGSKEGEARTGGAAGGGSGSGGRSAGVGLLQQAVGSEVAAAEHRGLGSVPVAVAGPRSFWGGQAATTPAGIGGTGAVAAGVSHRGAGGGPVAAQGPRSGGGGEGLAPSSAPPLIVEVGTGSGAVLGSLLLGMPGARGVGIELSAPALALTEMNLREAEVMDRCTLLAGDLLEPLDELADLIVSNPPYIAEAEWSALEPGVKDWEPKLALVGGADGLEVYRRLVPQAFAKLKPGGALAVEIGATQAAAVARLFQETGFIEVAVTADMAERPRVVAGHKKDA